MRIPKLRFSVRSVLVGVSVIAVVLGIARWTERNRRISIYREFERSCAGVEHHLREVAKEARAAGNVGRAVSCEKAADENARLKSLYGRAAVNPWGPLPDPSVR